MNGKVFWRQTFLMFCFINIGIAYNFEHSFLLLCLSAKWLYDAYSVFVFMCLSLSLSAPPLASSFLWKSKQLCKSALPVIVSPQLELCGPDLGSSSRYVADGSLLPYGPKQNHRVLEETRPLNARYAWPNGVWICPDACKPSSQP